MIEYKPKPNRENDFLSDTPSLISGDLPNPFPGLRPFDINEYHLFFGREGHSDQILEKLSKSRFISILGYSGSGKSSLMYCGVIPILHGGFMTEAGSNWNVITTRPGTSPFKNLASSILKSNSLYNESTPDETQYRQIAIESILRGDQEGLLRALNYFKKPEKQNYLIYIDQFEELIRFKKENKSSEVQEETLNYVDLLIQTLKSTDNSVYIALSMRSEFLGECSVFRGLTNLINQSNFLVPRLSWHNRRKVIEGPVSVAGGAISNRLLNRLLEEVGDNQDQLPILQHALMRSWNYWKENRDEGESIDLRHYNAIGKMSGALSQHADEIFEELTSKQKHITEILFKLLTEKGQDNLGLRKSAMLSNVSKLSGATDEEVIEVVEAFRKPERSFLMPAFGIPLSGESLIEISHESLMRIWVRLKNWVDEEHESSQMYMRLSDASEMYQIGRTGLWRPPDLQLALNWQKKQKPNLIWARRYNEAFERTIVFLDTSRITYEAEQKSQEMQQKRLLRRTRLAAIFLAIAFIIAIAFFIFGVVQQKNAEREAALAIENETLAKENLKLANLAKLDADSARQVADQQRLLVELSAQELQDAVSKLRDANSNLISAISRESAAREDARIERDNAIQQSILAERKSHEADSASRRANENFKQAQRLLYLQVAQSMSAKSVNIEDDDLKGLLAFQAFIFNKEFEGRKYDPYIYNGLHSTLAQIDGKTYNTLSLHRNSVRSVAFPNSSEVFFSTGADGKMIRNEFTTGESVVLSSSKYRNKIVEVNGSATLMVSGGDSTFINVFDLQNESKSPVSINVHDSYINDIAFMPDDNRVITSGGDKTIKITDVSEKNTKIIKENGAEFKVLDISKDGKKLVAGALNGTVSVFDIGTWKENVLTRKSEFPVYSVAFSPDGKILAIGDESGHVELWNTTSFSKTRDLISHKSRVSDVEFSDNGLMLATSSLDGSINIWVLDELNELPISLTDNDSYVWDVDFSPDSKFLLAACDNGEIRIWTTEAEDLVENMCKKLNRNLTLEEWEQYVGNELPYMNTCDEK